MHLQSLSAPALFIGSEGTLGVVTQVLLKLLPKPVARQTLLATFIAMDAAAETVSAIIAARIIPCTLEFLDQEILRCVEDFTHVGIPRDVAAILLVETAGHPATILEDVTVPRSELAGMIRAVEASPQNTTSTSPPSATSATATCTPPFSPTSATPPRCTASNSPLPRSSMRP